MGIQSPLSQCTCNCSNPYYHSRLAKNRFFQESEATKNQKIGAKFSCVLILTQAEGWITGLAVKMFTIAGPVLVYGVSASVVYGVVYYLAEKA